MTLSTQSCTANPVLPEALTPKVTQSLPDGFPTMDFTPPAQHLTLGDTFDGLCSVVQVEQGNVYIYFGDDGAVTLSLVDCLDAIQTWNKAATVAPKYRKMYAL